MGQRPAKLCYQLFQAFTSLDYSRLLQLYKHRKMDRYHTKRKNQKLISDHEAFDRNTRSKLIQFIFLANTSIDN
ncbi:hypothetical protein H5410_046385 [Solanum commersonii]|uniref:Uncharacterized protein n=1 Tax=Solanum commersonii TaxID=4109 RepID=A0A9J5XEA3_SOLCO|nr:hypothetical protein H5410_046385 [Solanum commersonii]